MYRILLYILMVFFSVMLGTSGVYKALDASRFATIAGRLYDGFPTAVYRPLALGFIVFEFGAAAALWFRPIRVRVSWSIALVMWFLMLVHVRILLFFPHLDCGCFGRLFNRPPGFRTLAENAVFFLSAVLMARLARAEEQQHAV